MAELRKHHKGMLGSAHIAPALARALLLAVLACLIACALLYPSSLVWGVTHASWVAQRAAPVGAAETDVRAALGEPRRVLGPGEEWKLPFKRPIQARALLYDTRMWACPNWVVVYIDSDGLVQCSAATIMYSE